ncbi:MAG: glycosyltransferase family 2 protein [Candidatus Pseudobacter hemicellulosilyticus]|uniref:Glycosyltransferase family 2 protein n=1 Tax=Candidatus Pseudobacter hemicellulosilyticus TaxID=3121375 RepID=A0AAJ5WXQ5_9BACT|nr:MAG: glycosyltransferase family 2 protein [Pseudobacter sp.]
MLTLVLHILFGILFAYLAINTLYFFITSVAGKFYRAPNYQPVAAKKRIAVLIPTYKEDHIIINTVQQALQHDYPRDKFTVFVAADKLQPATIAQLRAIPANVLEVRFELSSKARSLNQLLNYIPENEYDVAIIIDADNIMLPGCLEKVNAAFQKGFRAVQCHRIAKNANTPVAVLDGLSEEINNHIFRRGQRALGFSSNTIGSGMAFEFKKLKDIYNKPGILGNPACDREVDFETMKADICIEFIDDAYVLDEKVSSQAVFERQRTRWMESQIIHLRLFFDKKQGHLPKTKDYWNKLFANLAPPRLLFLLSYGLIAALFAIEYFTGISILYPPYAWWFGLTLLYFLTFVIAIPGKFYNLQTLRAILRIPLLIWSVVRALFRMNVSRKEFLHTPKAFTQDGSK